MVADNAEQEQGLTASWPPDYTAIFRERTRRLQWLYDNPDAWAGVMSYYRTRPLEFIEDWCVTYDPRRTGAKTMPFILFKRQREFVQFLHSCLTENESGLVEKCRDVGATWLCACFSVWLWIFEPGASIGFGSRKESLVDEIGNMDSIFEKMRAVLRGLPQFMLPLGFKMKIHATYMKIQNPENGAIIKGESGDNIGRGGRSMIYFKDESAHYERPEKIEAALGDNTDVQIDISSVHGSANVFYRRRMNGEVWEPNVACTKGKTRVFVFDWAHHPAKTQEWFDRRRQKALDDGLLHVFAQEVERNYAGSIDRVIIPAEWARACIDAHIKLAHFGNWESGATTAAQDIADGGLDKNALSIKRGVVLKLAQHWGGEAAEAAHVALPLCVENGVTELFYDSIGVGAGFKAETNTMKKLPSWPRGFKVYGWNAALTGENLLDPKGHIISDDSQSPLNEDFYANLKAQAWFRLRARCWKTFQAVTQGKSFPVSEMASFSSSIPLIHQLIMELSQAVHAYTATGKTMVDKKPEGASSPNLADSVVMNYCPIRPAKGFFDVG